MERADSQFKTFIRFILDTLRGLTRKPAKKNARRKWIKFSVISKNIGGLTLGTEHDIMCFRADLYKIIQ